MSQPLRDITPLRLYLNTEVAAISEITLALQDAAAEAQRRINKLETKHGIGSIVERAQLASIRRELGVVQTELWRQVGRRIRTNGKRVADAAAEAERLAEQALFRATGGPVPQELIEAQQAYARATVETYLARGENGIGLSKRVYRTSQLANGFVDRQINRMILLGRSWQELARTVRPMISPDTPGGVSYAAKRLARTELNNAFHRTSVKLAQANPWVETVVWNKSGSHPRRDVCDDLADGHSKDQARGHYLPNEVPGKPHPQCLCYTTEETVSEDEFLDSLLATPLGAVVGSYGKAARSA